MDGSIRGVDVFGPLRCLGLIKLSLTPTTTPLVFQKCSLSLLMLKVEICTNGGSVNYFPER